MRSKTEPWCIAGWFPQFSALHYQPWATRRILYIVSDLYLVHRNRQKSYGNIIR